MQPNQYVSLIGTTCSFQKLHLISLCANHLLKHFELMPHNANMCGVFSLMKKALTSLEFLVHCWVYIDKYLS